MRASHCNLLLFPDYQDKTNNDSKLKLRNLTFDEKSCPVEQAKIDQNLESVLNLVDKRKFFSLLNDSLVKKCNNNCYIFEKLSRKKPKLIPETSLNLQAANLFSRFLLFRNLIRSVRLLVTSLAERSPRLLKFPTEKYGYPWS